MIELERNFLAEPLGTSAIAANRTKQSFGNEPTPQLVAMVCGAADQDQSQRCFRSMGVVTSAKMLLPVQ